MSVEETGTARTVRTAYEIAWERFICIPGLTPDEKMSGPDKLRAHIRLIVDAGESEPTKIAATAMGLLRQEEQIARSKARLATASKYSSAA
jgi:hypothetical protein